MDNYQVIISGLGPTGLTLAHMLGMRGHSVLVLEREPVFYGNARAVYTDDECLRIFQHLGFADKLSEKMLSDVPVNFTYRDCKPVSRYQPRGEPYGWPIVNFFYQPYLETTLAEELGRYPNVVIKRGRELVDFEQNGECVKVTHQATQQFRFRDDIAETTQGDGSKDLQTVSGEYLIGADGGRSFIRESLGIELFGDTFEEPWLVVDLELKEGEQELRHLPYFNFVIDPGQPVVSCIQPDAFHRFEFMLRPGETAEYMEHPDTVRKLVSEFVDFDKFTVKRKLVYSFKALVAKEWVKDRVIIAGDAAHMTPQFMGQGASSGFRDGYNLGWKLSAVLKGHANPRILSTYNSERYHHAKAMVNASVMMKDIVSTKKTLVRLVRDTFIFASRTIKPIRNYLQQGGFKPQPIYKKGAFLGLERRKRKGPEGTLSPQPRVRLIDGSQHKLDDVAKKSFTLIGLEVDPRAGLTKENLHWLDVLDPSFISMCSLGWRPQGKDVAHMSAKGLVEVEDMTGDMVNWFKKAGFKKDAVAILRPDRFTFAVVSIDNLNSAVDELRKQLGSGKPSQIKANVDDAKIAAA